MNRIQFIEMLVCPACRGKLTHRASEGELHCGVCAFTFPIIDDIPVLFSRNVKLEAQDLVTRYWDSEEKANVYDTHVEGGTIFSEHNHQSEVRGLIRYFESENLDF